MKKKILKISLIGKTNAGKSTLLNSLVGEKISIENKKINTTEESIRGVKNIGQNQLIYLDTPGLNYLKKIDKKNIKFKKNLWNGIDESDVIMYIIDTKKYNLQEIINNFNILTTINKKFIFIFNKNDLINNKFILPKIKDLKNKFNIDAFFSISAKKKLGIIQIEKYLLQFCYNSKWIYNDNEISNKDDIFITNECTRNEVLNFLHKEIPYNLIITNKIFKYLKNGDLKIKQEIKLNNKRYKKIILGKKGEKIKKIRMSSQYNISKILKNKVHLYINIVN